MMEPIEAEFTETTALAVVEPAALAQPMTADVMLERLKEWERFKATAVRPGAWISIPGVRGKYLPAAEVMRLAPAAAVSWPIISHDEHGDPGVRRVITEDVKGGKIALYTVTIRATDGNGRYMDAVGAWDSSEGKKSDYNARQMALTRARRKATLTLMGGVDEDAAEEVRNERRTDQAHFAENAVPNIRALLARAVSLGAVTGPDDFYAWVHIACGLTKQKGDAWPARERMAVADALDKFEGIEPPEGDG